MGEEREPRPVAAAGNSRDEVRPLRDLGVELAGDPVLLEVVAEQLCRAGLVPGRVDRVEADQLLEELADLVAERLRSATRPVHEDPLALVLDLAVARQLGVHEIHPGPMQLLAPLVVEGFGKRPRRSVAGGEELPVRLAARETERERCARSRARTSRRAGRSRAARRPSRRDSRLPLEESAETAS